MFLPSDFAEGQVVVSEERRQLRELAQAIRRGCLIRPKQCTDVFWQYDGVSACALGAAMATINPDERKCDQSFSELKKRFSILSARKLWFSAITKRNDVLGWTREQIASWLEAEAMKR